MFVVSPRFPTQPWPQRLRWMCAVLLMCVAGLCQADTDHDRARRALEAGEILPLATLLQRVERDHAGQVLDVELDREKDGPSARWIYKIKLLRPGGALVKLKIDGRDGSLISQKGKDRPVQP